MILGYSDEETVMLDLDETPYKSVLYYSRWASEFFSLDGFLIAKSSPNNYHVIFNKKVTWSENMKIVAGVVLVSHKEKLKTWLVMQCRKEWSTLRVTPKGEKPSPRIVYREGRQDGQIQEYLEYRQIIKKIWRDLSSPLLEQPVSSVGQSPTH